VVSASSVDRQAMFPEPAHPHHIVVAMSDFQSRLATPSSDGFEPMVGKD
jgi:hypothetical protein